MKTVTLTLPLFTMVALLTTLGGPVWAGSNTDTTTYEGRIDTNDTDQRDHANDNATYQEGRDNANRTRQRGADNWNGTAQFGKFNYNEIHQHPLGERHGPKKHQDSVG